MNCRLVVIALILSLTPNLYSQTARYNVSGIVQDSLSGDPVEIVVIGIEALNVWTVTSADGSFIIRGLPPGRNAIVVSCMGYTRMELTLFLESDTTLNIKILLASLAVGEVVVTGQRGSGLSTSTNIGRRAIEHLQPSSISEILQLLPGQLTVGSNLTSVSQLSIREVSGSTAGGISGMASLGTALRIDGAPISNIANLQTMSSTQEFRVFQSTAMQGADVRQLPVDNIESIEVVRGIPGVEEGDALSGVVKVNLVKGSTPFTTRVKIDPTTKQGFFGKGFTLRGDMGSLNTSFDIAQSHSDIRAPIFSYNRLSTYLAYNNTFFRSTRPLHFSLSTSLGGARSLSRQDPDKLRQERLSNMENNLRITTSGRWQLNTLLLTSLNINLSASSQRQENFERRFRSFGSVQVLPVSFMTGEFEAPYLIPLYYSEVTVDGRPYYYNATVSGLKSFSTGRFQHIIRAGTDYSLSGNNGLGSIYDILQPPTGSGFRPRPFNDIPDLERIALYISGESKIPLGTTLLELQAGVRFNNIQPDGVFRSKEDLTALDPRINLRYHLFENRPGVLTNLGIRLGYGLQSLTPTLAHLYPDKSYRDLTLFNYYQPPNSMAVVYTDVVEDTRNYNLRTASSKKYEAGISAKAFGADFHFTGYLEYMKDGFSHHSVFAPLPINRYQQLPSGVEPQFIQGTGVFYIDPVTNETHYAELIPDTVFRSYRYPENTLNQIKRGIEFEADAGRIERLRTSFHLTGAYMFSRRVSTKPYYSTESSVRDQIVGIYHAGNDGRINERIVSQLRTVTHIRELAMVVSLNVQTIWMERNRSIHEDLSGNPLVYTLEPVSDPYSDITQFKYYKPYAVLNRDGTITPWLPEYDNLRPYADLIKNHNSTYHFIPSVYKPVFQLNMRLTKEISKSTSISFSANNLTNYQPLQKVKGRVDSYVRRNQGIYFSGEITVRL